MLGHLIPLMVVMMDLWASLQLPGTFFPPRCLMRPDYREMRLPSRGSTWLPGEFFEGKCRDVAAREWIRKPSGALDLFVHADGPSGSGRFWIVTVGLAGRQQTKPKRGFCLTTHTLGWRTLLEYQRIPLPWLGDLDNDGKSEVIIWSSFPLRRAAEMSQYGLVAWVYRLSSQDSLVIDWELSRHLAREIAAAYHSASEHILVVPELRKAAAAALEQFAERRCGIVANNDR